MSLLTPQIAGSTDEAQKAIGIFVMERIVEYIAANPVKAGLACNAEDWLFCSARDRFLRDGLQMAWLGDIL